MVPSPTDLPPPNSHFSRELSFKICLKSNLEFGSTPQPPPLAAPSMVSQSPASSGSGAQEHAEWGDCGVAAEQEGGGISGTRRGPQRLRPGSGVCAEKGAAAVSGLPSLAPGSQPMSRPGLAARQALLGGAGAEGERRPGLAPLPGWRQSRRPRRRQAGRVRTAGAPDLAGGGVSKALCLMASLFTEFTL